MAKVPIKTLRKAAKKLPRIIDLHPREKEEVKEVPLEGLEEIKKIEEAVERERKRVKKIEVPKGLEGFFEIKPEDLGPEYESIFLGELPEVEILESLLPIPPLPQIEEEELVRRVKRIAKVPVPRIRKAPVLREITPTPPVLIEREEGVERREELGVLNLPPVAHRIPEDLLREIPSEWKPVDLTKIDETYPLIPPYAFAHIFWDKEERKLRYILIEPELTEEEAKLLERIKEYLVDIVEIDLYEIKNVELAEKHIEEKAEEIIRTYRMKLKGEKKNKVLYYVIRDFVGLERIEPLMRDPNLEDISCDGVGIPIYVYHRRYGSMRTNIVFESEEELNDFVVKLAQRCGRHISVAEPLLDGALPDGSRVQATYSVGKDIAMKGSTFTIRKFTKDPLTIVDMMLFGTIPALMAAYLWIAIEHKNSILIAGGTATGKTSMLNALSMFIPEEDKIITIEDTPELNLPHEHWVAKIVRAGFGGGEGRGEVTMFDLLKAALRERPDELIVGEVRGREAYVLFQGMATGHAGMATIHADSVRAVIHRLQTPPINLSPGLLQHLNIIMIMANVKIKGKEVRRVKELVEIVDVDPKTSIPITNLLFRWNPKNDSFELATDRSYVLDRIIETKGISEESLWAELRRRVAVLEWMKKSRIRYYKDVSAIIQEYYRNPEGVLKRIGFVEEKK